MAQKIAVIIWCFNDNNFGSGGDKVNFYIIKALSELGYEIDLYCNYSCSESNIYVKNIFVKKYHKYLQRKHEYLFSFSEHISNEGTFSYIHENTRYFRNHTERSLFENIVCFLFRKNRYKENIALEKKQRETAKLIDYFLAPSEFIKKDLMESYNIDENKIFILPPLCDIKDNNFSKENHDAFTFGLSGRGFAHKGGYEIIFATVLLKLLGYNIKAKIIYPFSKSSKRLSKFINSVGLSNTIEIIDYCNNMSEFYKSIDCLVMASKREAFGLVGIEAISMNIPIITNSRCGIKDYIVNKENGFIYDFKNPLSNLLKTMKYVLDNQDKLPDISKKAYEIVDNFTYEKFKERIKKVIISTRKV